MTIKLDRIKRNTWFLRIMYKLAKFIPLTNLTKFKLFLNLEWFFDRISHEYSFKNYSAESHPVRVLTKKHLLEWIQPEHRVLDLGCASGEMTYWASEKAATVVGIDYNQTHIAFAKENYKRDNLSFYCQEAHDYLTSTDEQFDVMILENVLEHLDNPSEFIGKFSRFFKFIYIELPDFDKNYLNHYRKDFNLPLIYTDSDHVSEFNRFDLIEILEKNNLSVVHSFYIHGFQKLWCKVNKNNV
jgi:SAM-dependent methyltransferase